MPNAGGTETTPPPGPLGYASASLLWGEIVQTLLHFGGHRMIQLNDRDRVEVAEVLRLVAKILTALNPHGGLTDPAADVFRRFTQKLGDTAENWKEAANRLEAIAAEIDAQRT